MKKSSGKFLRFCFIIALSAACAVLVWFFMTCFEFRPPQIELHLKGAHIGTQKIMHLTAVDDQRGLRSIQVRLMQNEKQLMLLDEHLPCAGIIEGGSSTYKTVTLDLQPLKLGLKNGPAKLEVTVLDYSYSHWGRGNAATLTQDIIIDMAPPSITVLAATRYLNQGGAGIVLYRISKPVASQGILVGSRLYYGCPVPGREGDYQALFALPQDTAEMTLQVQAQDLAGNTAKTAFPHTIRKKTFRHDNISLSDSFLQSLSAKAAVFFPEFLDPASPLNTFLAVNTVLRSRNEEEFRRICSKVTKQQLWNGAFSPLPRASTRAIFGDQRSYMLDKKEISTSVHLGLDLASVDQAPVPAANSGTVAEIRQMGIYGLSVIIDHGQGLYSTYSHLSAATIQKGDDVKAGQTIAHTGATGLALGDHLHFGIMIQGVFVNPSEWIDANWIKQKIDLPLAEAYGR